MIATMDPNTRKIMIDNSKTGQMMMDPNTEQCDSLLM